MTFTTVGEEREDRRRTSLGKMVEVDSGIDLT